MIKRNEKLNERLVIIMQIGIADFPLANLF